MLQSINPILVCLNLSSFLLQFLDGMHMLPSMHHIILVSTVYQMKDLHYWSELTVINQIISCPFLEYSMPQTCFCNMFWLISVTIVYRYVIYYFNGCNALVILPLSPNNCHSSLLKFSQNTCHSHFPIHFSLFLIYPYLYLFPPCFLCVYLFHLFLIPVREAKVISKLK
jgi:hypothetical protein